MVTLFQTRSIALLFVASLAACEHEPAASPSSAGNFSISVSVEAKTPGHIDFVYQYAKDSKLISRRYAVRAEDENRWGLFQADKRVGTIELEAGLDHVSIARKVFRADMRRFLTESHGSSVVAVFQDAPNQRPR